MRLIDLDEFTKLSQNNVADLSSLEEELDINYVWDMGYIECLKVLDSCSVIKAIPIEFLDRWFGNNYNAFTDLMMAWEKENE